MTPTRRELGLDKVLSESPESPWCPILTQTQIQQYNKLFEVRSLNPELLTVT